MTITGFCIVTFHHQPDDAATFEGWLAGDHCAAMRALPGFVRALPFAVTPFQVLPDQPQPWPRVLIHEFTEGPTPDHLGAVARSFANTPALAPGSGRASHVFDWITAWRRDPDFSDPAEPMTHLFLVMSNATPGQDEEYNTWYDTYHIGDTLAVPGMIAMRRGKLAADQIEPGNAQPAGYVVLIGAQTDDVEAVAEEGALRTAGKSASGIVFEPLSPAVSEDRTIHVLEATGPALR